MELAVREEDYATAAEAKAEVDMLRERLPSDKMLLASLLDKLETRLPVSDKERMTAIRQLGDLGDMAAAPALAGCLHDGEPAVAEAAENALWAVFMRCPTPEMELLMQQGVLMMQRPEQWEAALDVFTELIDKAPMFAEAYNKRATVYYQLQRYHAAVVDCRVTLQFNPFHFAAASGMGMCCSAVGDAKGAVAAFEHAVALNPRLSHLRQHISQLRQRLQQEEGQSNE
jgi:tetratricopeptide (TPR) repeat protein